MHLHRSKNWKAAFQSISLWTMAASGYQKVCNLSRAPGPSAFDQVGEATSSCGANSLGGRASSHSNVKRASAVPRYPTENGTAKPIVICPIPGRGPHAGCAAVANSAGGYDREKEMTMRRRDLLTGAGSLAVGATVTLPAPAIAQGLRELKMVTDWPETMPGLHTSAARFAQTIGAATSGRIKIRCFRPTHSYGLSRPSMP